MTLVIAVPTSKGLVIAADSRVGSDVAGRVCDEAFKLLVLERPERTALTVTNVSGVRVPGNEPDFCKHLRESRVILEFPDLARRYLLEVDRPIWQVAPEELISQGIAPTLAALNEDDLEVVRPLLAILRPNIVLFSYDPDRRVSWIRAIVVSVDAELAPSIESTLLCELKANDKPTFWRIGEKEYFDQHFMNEKGLALLPHSTRDFIRNSKKRVDDISMTEAIDAAVGAIKAASELTQSIPASSGIGGPVDVLFLGSEPKPQQIRWKK